MEVTQMATRYADKVMNGTHGSVWVDDEEIAEATAVSGKLDITYDEIKMLSHLSPGRKMVATCGKGSITMNKVTSRFMKKISEDIKAYRTPMFEIISKLADPGALGQERIIFHNCTFDDLTLADWEAGVSGKIEAPFVFESYDILDSVDATI